MANIVIYYPERTGFWTGRDFSDSHKDAILFASPKSAVTELKKHVLNKAVFFDGIEIIKNWGSRGEELLFDSIEDA